VQGLLTPQCTCAAPHEALSRVLPLPRGRGPLPRGRGENLRRWRDGRGRIRCRLASRRRVEWRPPGHGPRRDGAAGPCARSEALLRAKGLRHQCRAEGQKRRLSPRSVRSESPDASSGDERTARPNHVTPGDQITKSPHTTIGV
jgi:hypothetical protein